MVAKNEEVTCMSNFSAKLNPKRPCRYVFEANLWSGKDGEFKPPVKTLVDTVLMAN